MNTSGTARLEGAVNRFLLQFTYDGRVSTDGLHRREVDHEPLAEDQQARAAGMPPGGVLRSSHTGLDKATTVPAESRT